MCIKKFIEITKITSVITKKLKMEKIEFRAYIKIRSKIGVSEQTITD